MRKLPYMPMFWEDFFADPVVRNMPIDVRGVYLLMLGLMWVNKGWLSADDKVIARLLEIDIRSWRLRYKPQIVRHFAEKSDPIVGTYYTQKRLEIEWEKASERTERFIANLGERARKKPDRTTKRSHRAGGGDRAPNRPTKSAAEPAVQQEDQGGRISNTKVENSSALQAENYSLPPIAQDSGSHPHEDDAIKAVRSDLTKRLVADGLKGKSLSDIANMGKR